MWDLQKRRGELFCGTEMKGTKIEERLDAKDLSQIWGGEGGQNDREDISPFRVPGGGKLIIGTFILNRIELERS